MSTSFSSLSSLAEFRLAIATLPYGDDLALRAASTREAILTKPARSLGRLEDLTAWLSYWQRRHPPRLERAHAIVFAGNHGVVVRGVSAFPTAVTAQMVANYRSGGAAINQLCEWSGATLAIVPLELNQPTADFSREPAMTEPELLRAVNAGIAAVVPETDALVLGEMGIGNTTSAAALSAALFGGGGSDWVGPGTGVDQAGIGRKAKVVDEALACHGKALADPIEALRRVGGRELAAIAGAILTARHHGIPVILDGFVCTAGAAPLFCANATALDHCLVGHASAEPGHRRLLNAIGQKPLLDLGMRLGEGSGAALALGVVKAALATHVGMATFADAGISEKN